ncbi:MAG: HigA family addiction module antidote protein [Prevotellaceae bacterium]|jgi:addiction module HigA family antidote|nr:HigA family addiction module antidote protein [Prevotellaceae bacterium]
MKKLKNICPGEILLEEFLIPMNISQYKLSKELKIPQTRISEIIKGNRRMTADTALRLSLFFGNSAKFWLGLQDDFDIENETQIKHYELQQIRQLIMVNY